MAILLCLRTSPLVRNLAAVTGGTALAQAITFLLSPLITRIYSPEVFGLQGVFLSMISILWTAVAFRYPLAIVMADSEQEVRGIVRLSVLIALVFSFATAMVLLAFRQPLLALIGADGLGWLIYFLPLGLFLAALQDILEYRATRYSAFRVLAGVTVAQAFIVNLARVLGGLIKPVAVVLVTVSALSYGLNALMVWLGVRRRQTDRTAEEPPSLIQLAWRYREFPLFRMPADLINAVGQAVPVFGLTLLSPPAAVGFYVLARGVVNLPLSLIGGLTGHVFYSRLVEMAREGQPLFPFTLKATLFQLAVPGGALAVTALVFPPLFSLVFGEAWRTAGEYAQWMSLWIICMLANIPTVRALPVIGRQGLHLAFNSLIAAGGILGLLAGHHWWGPERGAIALYSVVMAGLYSLQILTYLREVRAFDQRHTNA